MSTSRSRLTRSIGEIAKRDSDLRRAIEATKPRGDQPSAAGVGTSDAERDRICCDGSVSDETNPGAEERDTSEGGQDASDGLNPNDPADISDMGPGSLTGLTDCATGEPVCFEGSDWVPPEGWSAPNNPPQDPLYTDGTYWFASGGSLGNFYSPTPSAFCRSFAAATTANPGVSNTYYSYYKVINDDSIECYGTNDLSDDPDYYKDAQRNICTQSDGGYCSPSEEERALETEWPSDSCVNLAIRNGSIVGSKYDPENDGSYSKPMSEIELCDDFGNSFYLAPSANGGWKSISDLTTGPDGHLYDSTGMQIRRISHDEFTDSTV